MPPTSCRTGRPAPCEFERRLSLIAYDQSPATLGVLAEIRPATIARKALAVAATPLDGGWKRVMIHAAAALRAALDQLARAVEDRNDITARQNRQMSHRI